MPIIDLFSKRQKKLRGEIPDVYQYDRLPEPLRVQIIHIMYDALGNEERYYEQYYTPRVKNTYASITDALCREYGVFRLPAKYYGHGNKMMDLVNFFLQVEDIEKAIDVIELSFWAIDVHARNQSYLKKYNSSEIADQAIQELNDRFKEHGVGYHYANGRIIRVDDEFIHSEVVRPALGILNRKEYTRAQEEFLNAHKHYRKGRTKEALNECLKSLESVMKSICNRRGWSYDERDGANKLIGICFDNGIIPSFWQSQLTALKSLLESSVPTARNKLSAHGSSAAPQPVPPHIASYVLHMTAATIVFLAEAGADDSRA